MALIAGSGDFLNDLRAGAFMLETCLPEDLAHCAAWIETYRDLNLGLAEACVIACAERLKILRILTVHEHHFLVVHTAGGKSLILLPADA